MNHPRDWSASLGRDVVPRLGDRPVSEATSTDLLDVLTPTRHSKPGTARRARQRISAVMQWAVAMEFRTDNPGRPHRSDARTPAGRGAAHAGVAHGEVAAARSGELRLAQWTEIDRDAGVWTISAGRMKANREHRVPLSRNPCRRQRSQVRPFLGEPRRPSKRTMTFRHSPPVRARTRPKIIYEDGSTSSMHLSSLGRDTIGALAATHAQGLRAVVHLWAPRSSTRRRRPPSPGPWCSSSRRCHSAPPWMETSWRRSCWRTPATRPISSMQRETVASRFPPAATRKTSNVWSRAPALPIQAPGPASPFTASCGSCCAPG